MKIGEVLAELEVAAPDEIELEHPDRLEHGDYASNVAMVVADGNPRDLAQEIVEQLKKDLPDKVQSVEVAGPGFINFTLTGEFFVDSLHKVLDKNVQFGSKNLYDDKKKIFEYTTQNLMKVFHVGHLMSHVIGNAIANVHEAEGAEVKRNSYQGDVGMHIAKVIWAIKTSPRGPFPDDIKTPQDKAHYLGAMYALGDAAYSRNDLSGFSISGGKERLRKEIEKIKANIEDLNIEDRKVQIKDINKKIYSSSTTKNIDSIYEKACSWSKESYQAVYSRLGVDLDFKFYESKTTPKGRQIVLDGLEKGIFEKSEGAIVYPGEKYGLHTRVFINSEGIPTYEAKDLGLMKVKYNAYQYDEAIVFTANEQNEYFEVVLDAAKKALPEIGDKTTHIGHGILQLPSGKMSSRTGDILSAEKLLDLVHEKAMQKISGRIDGGLEDEAAEDIAQAAVRYSILKQDIGKDITFDPDQALSFEGNSGPYLQYTHARAHSLLQEAGVTADDLKQIDTFPDEQPEVARLLYRFPEVVEHSARDYAPRYIANYLYQVGQSFNTFYGNTKIVGEGEREDYRLALTAATAQVLENGLKLLGIEAPKEM